MEEIKKEILPFEKIKVKVVKIKFNVGINYYICLDSSIHKCVLKIIELNFFTFLYRYLNSKFSF